MCKRLVSKIWFTRIETIPNTFRFCIHIVIVERKSFQNEINLHVIETVYSPKLTFFRSDIFDLETNFMHYLCNVSYCVCEHRGDVHFYFELLLPTLLYSIVRYAFCKRLNVCQIDVDLLNLVIHPCF